MRLDAGPEPVVHGPHLHIDTLQCAERPLDLRQALVGRDRRFRPEFIRWQTGSDDIKAIEPRLGCDLVLLAAEGEVAVGDLKREVFLHLILVDDFADREADCGGPIVCASRARVLCRLLAHRLGNARQLTFCRL